MKNCLTGFLGLTLFSLAGNAQQQMTEPGGVSKDIPGSHHLQTVTKRTNIVSDWYNYGNTIFGAGGNVSYFRNFMFPDSTVRVEFTSGMGYVWKHSIGEVFDPTSGQFDFNGQVSAPYTAPYTLDSIAIPYRYWRYQTSVSDTLVIQVYTEPNITLVANPGWSSGASYANVAYDHIKRIGKNETVLVKYLLTSADTSTLSQGLIKIPVNLSVPAGKKVAATATYFPGNPYSLNDTIDTYTSYPVTNHINAFVLYDYRDNDFGYEPLYYNNELVVTKDVRYNINVNGWNDEYIPGTAWVSGIYYGDLYFKITFDTDYAGIHETAQTPAASIYPNPTTGDLYFSSAVRMVKATILDLDGKTMLSESGNFSVIHTDQLRPAVYVLQLTDEKGRISRQRFVKQQ
jgi:hypothetical protein